MLKHSSRLWLISLFAGWCIDQLFWQKEPGISFLLTVMLLLGLGMVLAFGEGMRPAAASTWLLLPAIFFAGMTFGVSEPFTVFVNVLLALTAMAILALALRSGSWPYYSLVDYGFGMLKLMLSTLILPIKLISEGQKKPKEDPALGQPQNAALRRILLPVVRGLLLALPIVAILAGLLASADPIFADQLKHLTDFFKLDRLFEYIFRAVYIAILAYILVGVYGHSLLESANQKLIGVEKPLLPSFLGWIESVIILGSVDLLFAFFVSLQFRYFFGGQANITITGFTYAEYARRGFSELVAVACISLLLSLGLSTITRRTSLLHSRSFSGLSIGLVALVAVILVSAFQRLLLYEAAYGFSRIRTYTHVFIVWLGVLLVATVILELVKRLRAFALAALLVSLGFGLTLNILGVDAFIAQQNVTRAIQGQDLDTGYLYTLSDDAVPTLVDLFHTANLPVKIKDDIGATLACRAAGADTPGQDGRVQNRAWPSFHYARSRAENLLIQNQVLLKAYPVKNTPGEAMTVTVGGKERSCYGSVSLD